MKRHTESKEGRGKEKGELKEVKSALQNSFFITTSFAANHHTITTNLINIIS